MKLVRPLTSQRDNKIKFLNIIFSFVIFSDLVEADYKFPAEKSDQVISASKTVEAVPKLVDIEDLKVCAEENPYCALSLGVFNLYGEGVEKNYQTAFELFSFAAKHDIGSAHFHIGIMYKDGSISGNSDFTQAFEAFSSGASLGNIHSQIFLESAYETGEGVKINYKKALKWHLAASAQGDDTEQRKVCDYYTNGWGTEIDYEK